MKKAVSVIGIINGILSFIFAYYVNSMDTGKFISRESYGGDAYTGIQNAAANSGNNIQELCMLVQSGFTYFFIVFGIAMIVFGLYCMFGNTDKKNVTAIEIPANNVQNNTTGIQ